MHSPWNFDYLSMEQPVHSRPVECRRFVRAAQASYKVPTLNLEFLGNFLAELTLLEYGFLPFLPSMIAASAVYMAKLTLDSSTCPWVCSFLLHHVLSLSIEAILYSEMRVSSSLYHRSDGQGRIHC